MWDTIIEEKIREAQRKGQFERLRGEGKPLPKDDFDPMNEDWLANHILKENEELPPWLQLRKEIYDDRPGVIAAIDEYDRELECERSHRRGQAAILARLEEIYVRRARAINLKIDTHNLWCPSRHLELARFPEDLLRRTRKHPSY